MEPIQDMQVIQLDASSDDRGWSFSVLEEVLGKIGHIKDMHIAAIRPGATRGNHYHARRGELIAVVYQDRWSLHWDTGVGTPAKRRDFSGAGAVALVPPLNWSHAVRNDGATDLMLVASSDVAYDRHAASEIEKDAVRRVVTD